MELIALSVLAFAAICAVAAVRSDMRRRKRLLERVKSRRRITTIRRNYGLKQRQEGW